MCVGGGVSPRQSRDLSQNKENLNVFDEDFGSAIRKRGCNRKNIREDDDRPERVARARERERIARMRTTYTLVRCIAHSDNGDVFLAVDDVSGAEVAIHVVDLENLDRRALTPGSRRIAQHSQCQTPHMKAFVSSYVIPNTTMLCHVSEYMEYSMKDVITAAQGASLSESAVSDAIRVVLLALRYLHDKEIPHRNVKASSVLLGETSSPQVKLAPFSIFGKTLNKAQTLPYWLAPEVLKAELAAMAAERAGKAPEESPPEESSLAQDIWSVGIAALEMATGAHPYADLDRDTAIAMIAQGRLGTPLPSRLSKTFQSFVSLCLTKDPSQRPTPTDLLEHKFMTKPRKGPRLADYARKLTKDVRMTLTPRFGVTGRQDSGRGATLDWDFTSDFGHTSTNAVSSVLGKLCRMMTQSVLEGGGEGGEEEGMSEGMDAEAREASSKELGDCFAMIQEVFTELLTPRDQKRIESNLLKYLRCLGEERLREEYKAFDSKHRVVHQSDIDVNKYIRMGVFSRFVIQKMREK